MHFGVITLSTSACAAASHVFTGLINRLQYST